VEKLREARPYVIVGAFVVAAIVTPPDVLSQFMLAVPMCLLYEAGLFLARFVGARPKAESLADSGSGS
jgi:sec-independent protein translocase protein TatC